MKNGHRTHDTQPHTRVVCFEKKRLLSLEIFMLQIMSMSIVACKMYIHVRVYTYMYIVLILGGRCVVGSHLYQHFKSKSHCMVVCLVAES